VLSSISTSQSTSAELLVLGRQDTICGGAIRRFCEGAPVSNIPGTRHKSVHRIASARFRPKNGAPGVDECNITTISCSRAIALLLNCETDIANGSPYTSYCADPVGSLSCPPTDSPARSDSISSTV
jgi:hypothetical protein